MQLEDLGFCDKGQGRRFVADGNLISGVGRLPFNTDGGGLCNNHPNNRGGMTKIIEAVRQLHGEAHPAVQVPDCALALASGIGGSLGMCHAGSVVILERDQTMTEPTRPALFDNPETDPFWQAAARGQLVLPTCRACNSAH